MQTNSLFKKSLVVGIIALFVGVSSISIQSVPIERLSMMRNIGPRQVNWTVNGTMGLNGWYVSAVTFTCTYDHEIVAGVYYKVHAGDEWELYTEPFTVYTQGVLEFYWYWVDYQGNTEAPEGPFAFKIDYTAPTITLTVIPLNLLKTKWLLNATVADATSGVLGVEFLIDNHSIGNVTASPYIFTYKGHGKTAQARTCDFAGNSANSTIFTPCLVNLGSYIIRQNIILQKMILFVNLFHNLLLNHQTKGWNQ